MIKHRKKNPIYILPPKQPFSSHGLRDVMLLKHSSGCLGEKSTIIEPNDKLKLPTLIKFIFMTIT